MISTWWAGRLLAVTAVARTIAVVACLFMYCWFEFNSCEAIPLASTVTGGYQDQSSSFSKSLRFWIVWPIVLAENCLAWYVLRDAYPEEAAVWGYPKLFRVCLALWTVLDLAEESVRLPGYHQNLAIAAYAFAVVAPALLLRAYWVIKGFERTHYAVGALEVASVAWVLFVACAVSLISFYPSFDHKSIPATLEYIAFGIHAVMLAGLGTLVGARQSCAIEQAGLISDKGNFKDTKGYSSMIA